MLKKIEKTYQAEPLGAAFIYPETMKISIVGVLDSASIDDYVFYLKNDDSEQKFHLDEIHVWSDSAVNFDIKFVTGTASGTAIPSTNWNRSSANTPQVTALNSGVTGVTEDGHIIDIDTEANSWNVYKFEGALILGDGNAFAIQVDSAANVHINVIGGFE